MKKHILSIMAGVLTTVCFAQAKESSNKADTIAVKPYQASIDMALMDRVLSQRGVEITPEQKRMNESFTYCANRLKMLSGKNRAYLVDFFNQVLGSASHAILSDGSVQENYMRILHDLLNATNYAFRNPNIDLEKEMNSGKSKLAPLILY